MVEEITDFRLQWFLQKWIDKHEQYQGILRNLYHCGKHLLEMQGVNGIHILSNGTKSANFGLKRCHSSWSCPHCSATVMSKHANQIACALDALAHKGYSAMMITFTIPHLPFTQAEDSLKVLNKAWRAFVKEKGYCKKEYTLKSGIRKQTGNTVVGEKGEEKEYLVHHNPFNKFLNVIENNHHVCVYEVTHGKNSFHPHIHSLWWAKNKHWNKIKDMEEMIAKHWWKVIKRYGRKYWEEKLKDDPEKAEYNIDQLFNDEKAKSNMGLHISKDKDGNIRKITSAIYMAGWSGDAELTQLHYKEAHNGHLTPRQILIKAYQSKDPEEVDKLMKLYMEYAIATKGKKRISYSKGLNQIVQEWKKTETYFEMLKKRVTEGRVQPKWKTVFWFSKKQWLDLLDLNNQQTDNTDIISEIMKIAAQPKKPPDIFKEIKELCEAYGLETYLENIEDIPHLEWIESVFGNDERIKAMEEDRKWNSEVVDTLLERMKKEATK